MTQFDPLFTGVLRVRVPGALPQPGLGAARPLLGGEPLAALRADGAAGVAGVAGGEPRAQRRPQPGPGHGRQGPVLSEGEILPLSSRVKFCLLFIHHDYIHDKNSIFRIYKSSATKIRCFCSVFKINFLQVEFALKLGYPEDLTRKALGKVGLAACNVSFI